MNQSIQFPDSQSWPWPDSFDALLAAPRHHDLLLENDRVRVIHTHIPVGDLVPVHTHRWPGVVYLLSWSDFIRRDHQGNVLLDSRKTGSTPRFQVYSGLSLCRRTPSKTLANRKLTSSSLNSRASHLGKENPATDRLRRKDSMPRDENVELLHRASLRSKARDLDGYLEMYSPSVIHHGFSSRIKPGVPGLRDHYSQLLKASSDMRVDIGDIIADGEKVAHRFTFYGTHKAEFLKISATGKSVTASGAHLQHFQGGKCVEVWQILDTFRFLQQIGATSTARCAIATYDALATTSNG